MKPEEILRADLLDILFENRNRDYGAYILRRGYASRLSVALWLTLSGILIFFGFWYLGKDHILRKMEGSVFIPPDQIIKKIEIIPPPANSVEPKKAAEIKNATIRIVNNTEPADPPPALEDLDKDVKIGTETRSGIPPSEIVDPPSPPSGTGVDNRVHSPAAEEKEKIISDPDVKPEFPGGIEAFRRFMQRNLRVPEDELAEGQKVVVRIRFVVNREGKLERVEIMQSGGARFDDEVKRVLCKMPDWKPGIEAGKPVSAYFQLPVVFQSAEE